MSDELHPEDPHHHEPASSEEAPLAPSLESSHQELSDQVSILDEPSSGEPMFSTHGGPPQVSQTRAYPFWGWLDVFFFLVILAAGVLAIGIVFAGILGGLYFAGVTMDAPMSPVQSGLLLQFVLSVIALFMLSRLLRYRYQAGLREAVQLLPIERLGIYAGLGLATAILVSVLSVVLRLQDMDMPMNELIKTDMDLILVGIAAFTFGPIVEELIFRGFLQPLFVKTFGIAAGIAITSLIFALPHGPQYGWHWQHLLVITVAGSVFGVIRWRSGSTTASTIAHATYNGVLVVGAFVQRMNGQG